MKDRIAETVEQAYNTWQSAVKNPNPEVCKLCAKRHGKTCCETAGCHWAPADVHGGPTKEHIRALLKTGTVSIDYWEGEFKEGCADTAYFLRMRHVDAPVCDPSWGGTCVLLTSTGCALSFEQRPRGARELIPDLDKPCKTTYSKYDCIQDWWPYRHILKKLWDEFVE